MLMAPPPPVPRRVWRSLIKWDVLDGIVEFPHDALLYVEAALFLLGRGILRAYTHMSRVRVQRSQPVRTDVPATPRMTR